MVYTKSCVLAMGSIMYTKIFFNIWNESNMSSFLLVPPKEQQQQLFKDIIKINKKTW